MFKSKILTILYMLLFLSLNGAVSAAETDSKDTTTKASTVEKTDSDSEEEPSPVETEESEEDEEPDCD